MANLYKVREGSETHSKDGIEIRLVQAGQDQAIIKINEEIELDCKYQEIHHFKQMEKEFSIRLTNTFIEHWGGVKKCYVFALNS